MLEEIVLFYGLARKLIYDLDKEQVENYKKEIYSFAKEHCPDTLKKIAETKELSDESEEELQDMFEKYVTKAQREKMEAEELEENFDEGAE